MIYLPSKLLPGSLLSRFLSLLNSRISYQQTSLKVDKKNTHMRKRITWGTNKAEILVTNDIDNNDVREKQLVG